MLESHNPSSSLFPSLPHLPHSSPHRSQLPHQSPSSLPLPSSVRSLPPPVSPGRQPKLSFLPESPHASQPQFSNHPVAAAPVFHQPEAAIAASLPQTSDFGGHEPVTVLPRPATAALVNTLTTTPSPLRSGPTPLPQVDGVT